MVLLHIMYFRSSELRLFPTQFKSVEVSTVGNSLSKARAKSKMFPRSSFWWPYALKQKKDPFLFLQRLSQILIALTHLYLKQCKDVFTNIKELWLCNSWYVTVFTVLNFSTVSGKEIRNNCLQTAKIFSISNLKNKIKQQTWNYIEKIFPNS